MHTPLENAAHSIESGLIISASLVCICWLISLVFKDQSNKK